MQSITLPTFRGSGASRATGCSNDMIMRSLQDRFLEAAELESRFSPQDSEYHVVRCQKVFIFIMNEAQID